MDKVSLWIRLAPVGIAVLKGVSAALKWLGDGLSRAAGWLGTLYEELEGKKEAKP